MWRWTRDAQGRWPSVATIVESGSIELDRPKLSLALDRIYARIRPD